MTALGDLASIIRSKNAGPFAITFDVFFEDDENFERVVKSGVIDSERVAETFGVPEADVLGVYEVTRVNALKISLRRPVPAGDIHDTDVYGAQQHVPLSNIEVPDES